MTSNRTLATFRGSIANATFGAYVGYPTRLTRTCADCSAVLAVTATKTDERSWDAAAAVGGSSATTAAAAATTVVGHARRLTLMTSTGGTSRSPPGDGR